MEILILREIPTNLIFTLFTQMVKAQQLDSVAQLVRAPRNRRATGSISARGLPIVAFFAAVSG